MYKINNKTLIILAVLAIVLIIVIVSGLSIFDWRQNNINNKRPSITSISPTAVPVGTSAIDLKVYAHNLKNNSVINWNGSPVETDYTFISYGFLKTTISASTILIPGKYNITITNPPPNGSTSDPIQFQIISTLPNE